jgi:hypothetical protein
MTYSFKNLRVEIEAAIQNFNDLEKIVKVNIRTNDVGDTGEGRAVVASDAR